MNWDHPADQRRKNAQVILLEDIYADPDQQRELTANSVLNLVKYPGTLVIDNDIVDCVFCMNTPEEPAIHYRHDIEGNVINQFSWFNWFMVLIGLGWLITPISYIRKTATHRCQCVGCWKCWQTFLKLNQNVVMECPRCTSSLLNQNLGQILPINTMIDNGLEVVDGIVQLAEDHQAIQAIGGLDELNQIQIGRRLNWVHSWNSYIDGSRSSHDMSDGESKKKYPVCLQLHWVGRFVLDTEWGCDKRVTRIMPILLPPSLIANLTEVVIRGTDINQADVLSMRVKSRSLCFDKALTGTMRTSIELYAPQIVLAATLDDPEVMVSLKRNGVNTSRVPKRDWGSILIKQILLLLNTNVGQVIVKMVFSWLFMQGLGITMGAIRLLFIKYKFGIPLDYFYQQYILAVLFEYTELWTIFWTLLWLYKFVCYVE